MLYNSMEPPEKPNENDCCGSGCTPCIFDVYENELKRYEKFLKCDSNHTENRKTNILSQIKYIHFVVKIIEEFDDYRLFTFECAIDEIESDKRYDLIYNSGQYFILRAPDKSNGHFTRPYTPLKSDKCIRLNNERSVQLAYLNFQIIVKLYKDGLMSNYLDGLRIGDLTMWRGPYGEYKYKSNSTKHMLMISQGTAISPTYSIIHEILHDEDDDTKIMLMYCCKNISNILLRMELYDYLSNWNFAYRIFLSHPDSNGSVKYKEPICNDRLTEEDVKAYLSDKKNSIQIVISGSDAFMNIFKVVALNCDVDERCIYLL